MSAPNLTDLYARAAALNDQLFHLSFEIIRCRRSDEQMGRLGAGNGTEATARQLEAKLERDLSTVEDEIVRSGGSSVLGLEN